VAGGSRRCRYNRFGGLGSGQENTGVRIEDSYLDTYKDNYNESGTYTGTSTGEISITGTGGGEVDGDGSGHGVYVSNSEILAEQGNITINGTAGQGSASSASAGVFMDGAYIDTRTTDLTDPQDIVSGSVTIEGTATNGPGVFLANSAIEAQGGGSIFLTGVSGGYSAGEWATLTGSLGLTDPTLADFITYGSSNGFDFLQNAPSGVVLIGSELNAQRNPSLEEYATLAAQDTGAISISGTGGFINTFINYSTVSTYGGTLSITGTEADSSAYTFLCTGFTNNDALFSYRGDISISGYGRGDNSTGVYLGNDMQTGYDLNGEYSSDPSWLSSGITVVATLAGGTGGTALTADSSLSTYDGPLTITASAPVGETAIQTTDASFSTQGSNGTISISGSGQFELGYINYAAPEPPATGPAVFITTDASMVLNNNIELSSGYLELSAPGGISSIDSGKVLALACSLAAP